MVMYIRAPYAWLGGKYFELKWILPLIPKHEYYYEVFFGSGVVLLNKPKTEEEFANDINSRLISFWLCLQDDVLKEKLYEKCKNVLDSRFIYQIELKRAKELPEIRGDEFKELLLERALNFLYLCRFGYNGFPNCYYSPLTHTMYKIKNFTLTFRNIVKKLPKYYDRIKDVRFTNYNFVEFIEKCKPGDGKFFFVDPPYYNTHQYNKDFFIGNVFNDEDYDTLRELLEWQGENGSKWMITCNYNNPFFDGMENTKTTIVKRLAGMNNNKERVYVKTKIIMNYDINECGSILDINKKEMGDPLLV